jgi:hypothetical protein
MRDFRFGFSLATHATYADLVDTCRAAIKGRAHQQRKLPV